MQSVLTFSISGLIIAVCPHPGWWWKLKLCRSRNPYFNFFSWGYFWFEQMGRSDVILYFKVAFVLWLSDVVLLIIID